MPKDPTIAIRDCLTEIAILREVGGRMTFEAFRNDSIVRRAAAYAIQSRSGPANSGQLACRLSDGAMESD